ncbi:MAG: DUF5606 domain-containing protein [Salinivirgaceae bacterium]|nr:DUF5606 domain-containing protein [Salinivirgaceae bacterium]
MKEILSISGFSGLFKLVSSTKNGIIVEDIETKKRMPAYSTSKVSSLHDIAIFKDDGEEVSLIEVLKSIGKKEKNKAAIDPKTADNEKLKTYFAEILPNYDRERVYVSHIKKVLTWYNQLQRCNMLDVLDEKDDAEQSAEAEKK